MVIQVDSNKVIFEAVQNKLSICFRTGKRQLRVNETLGLSHHYRICEFGGFSCIKKESVDDRRAQHWASRLVPAVSEDCRKIFGEKGCPEAPPLGSPY